jgi:hypothetical protein
MVPLTIFHRLSLLGSGGGVNTGKNPPYRKGNAQRLRRCAKFHVYIVYIGPRQYFSVTTVTWSRYGFQS